MKKRGTISMLSIVIVSVFITIFSVNNIYAAGETKDITFENQNFYNAMKEELADKISSFNDDTKTITMTQENIDAIEYISFRGKDITSIKGIENFTNLKSLNFYYNGNYDDILDISPLSTLTKLTSIEIAGITIKDISSLKNCTNFRSISFERTSINDAPISENGFKDITVLKNMSNLSNLEISGYGITNVDSLSNLTKLTELKLIGCDVDDEELKNISNLTNLEVLYLGYVNYEGNNITNITPLSNLINLKELYLCNNEISDITPLANLIGLERLYLNQNNITDLTPISNLKNLKRLSTGRDRYGRGNPIKNIEPLSNLTGLVSLELSNGEIEDISCLKNLTELSNLDLSGNKISDASLIDDENFYDGIRDLSIELQNINIKTINKYVELPKIFLQAKDKNSKLYTEKDYILENCTLSADGKSVIINEGAKKASIIISGGDANLTKFNISINKLELSLSQTPENLTNKNVVVTITADKAVKPLEGWTLSDDKMTLTKEYEKNTTEEVSVTDEDGIVEKITVNITNIDKDAPVIEYSSKETENGGLEVTLKANEKIRPVDGWTLSDDEMTLTKTYTETATDKLKISDIVGNETEVTVKVIAIGNDVEIKDVDVENIEDVKEENNNPKTGDIIVYVGLALSIALVVLIVSKKYTKKESRI